MFSPFFFLYFDQFYGRLVLVDNRQCMGSDVQKKKKKKKKKKKTELETFVSASRHWYTGEFSTMSVIVFVDAETQYL